MQLMMIGGAPGGKAPVKMADPDAYLSHNDKLVLFDGVCLHTPGHSAGSCSFYWKQLNLLCSGDTLFKLNIGRTDLPGGST
jgi:glyoxylase-like metal-dependent hydrolase (beta-lactamase superfamily II)